MARTSNSNSTRGRSSASKNNNPTGKNQYSGGFGDYARERPFSAAAAAAAAVGAGVFLWSRRGQISEQISTLSDQLQEWNESRSEGMSDYDSSDSESFIAKPKRGRKSQSEIAEEALTLKSTGGSSNRPLDETASNQTKAGAVAY